MFRLSQLLELKSKPTVKDTPGVMQAPESMLVEKEPAMMRRTPPLRDTPPGSPAQIPQRSPPSLTPPPDIDLSGKKLDGFVMDSRLSHEPKYFHKKRTSSFRSSNGSGSVSGREEEVELQEADSTVSDPLMSHDHSSANKKTCSDESDEAIIIGELLSRVDGSSKGQSSKLKEEAEIDNRKEEEEEEGSHESHVTEGSTPPAQTGLS